MARLLCQADVEKLISMKDVVDILDKTYLGMGEGTVVNPPKGTLDLGESGPFPPYHADINSMPAYVGWVDTAGIKWAGGWMDNPAQGLPYVSALIILVNPRNGIFTGVMDGTLITNLRTGAQTAVALKYLFPERKSLSVGLFGAGVQGRTQTAAIAEIFDIDELKVYDVLPEAASQFARDMEAAVSGKIVLCASPEEAASGDAVITVTHAKDGFFKKEWFAPGTVLFPMGSYKECEDETLLSADFIVVDHVAQCLHRGALKDLAEAGKISESNIDATLGELAAGKKKVRASPSSRVLCIPIGTGAMDVAVAAVVLKRAEEAGIGSSFDFAFHSEGAARTK
jgi:ornithine cyclodeaminase/alanine dehydrogenase